MKNTFLKTCFRTLLVISLISTSAHLTVGADVPAFAADKHSKKKSKNLADGIYLIHREAPAKEKLDPLEKHEQVLVYDYEFLPPDDKGETSYLAISEGDCIPFAFAKAPAKEKDDKGRSKLMLTLADDQIKPLEQFTTKNSGKSIAIVIGGKVVTCHKIREPITGGKIQITRCSDNGCEVLYTQLTQSNQ